MIILLGTSHIAPESIKRIKKAIKDENPDCVAVELDPMRYNALKSGETTSPPGFFLKFLSWLQKELGKMTGIFPGQEMFESVKISRENNIPVCLIDQDFYITMNDINKIPLWEKIRLFTFTMFSGIGTKKIDLKKVPSEEVVNEAIRYLKIKFPFIYRILVLKRNRFMSKMIKELGKNHKKILVVVGAGHVNGLKKLLKGEKIKII